MTSPSNPSTDYPSSPLHKLWLGLRLRCPHCGTGHMSDGWFSLRETCPHCHVQFERKAGETTGAMMLLLSGLPLLGMALFFGMYIAGERSLGMLLGLPLAVVVIGSVVGYRHMRGLWVAVIELTGGLHADDTPDDSPSS